MRTSIFSLCILTISLAACADDEATPADTEGDTETTGTEPPCQTGEMRACTCAAAGDGQQTCVGAGEWGGCECGDASTTGTTGATDSSGSTTEGDLCGNGVEDDDEQCDDGNGIDDDDCSNECVPHCGVAWTVEFPGQLPGVRVDANGDVAVAYLRAMNETTAQPGWARIADDGTVIENIDVGPTVNDPVAGQAALTQDATTFQFGVFGLDGAAAVPQITRIDAPAGLVWTMPTPADLVFDSFGVGATPDGDPIVVAEIPVADGDTDVWVGKYAAADGSEVWTATHTGPTDGGFSLDEGGPVTVSGAGDVYVMGRLRKTFNRNEATLLRFASTGGAAAWEDIVVADLGDNNDQVAESLATGPDGAVAAGVTVFRSGIAHFEVVRYDGEDRVFTVDESMLDLDGEDFGGVKVGFDGDGNLAIAGFHDVSGTSPDPFFEAFIARYDATGQMLCSASLTGIEGANQIAVHPDGRVVLADGAGTVSVMMVRP